MRSQRRGQRKQEKQKPGFLWHVSVRSFNGHIEAGASVRAMDAIEAAKRGHQKVYLEHKDQINCGIKYEPEDWFVIGLSIHPSEQTADLNRVMKRDFPVTRLANMRQKA